MCLQAVSQPQVLKFLFYSRSILKMQQIIVGMSMKSNKNQVVDRSILGCCMKSTHMSTAVIWIGSSTRSVCCAACERYRAESPGFWMCNLMPKEKLADVEECLGLPLNPQAQVLVGFVRVDQSDIILIAHDPPETDCDQEDLPY